MGLGHNERVATTLTDFSAWMRREAGTFARKERLSLHIQEVNVGGSTQTFDWIFFAIVVPLPFLAALELLKTRFISERR